MKKLLIITVLTLFCASANSQDRESVPFLQEPSPSMVVSAGYVFSNEALKASFAYNSIYKRIGAYTSIETGLGETGSFAHILGGTVGLNDYLYVWGGIDFFTKRGLFNKGLNCRKEFGLAYSPIPNLTILPGYSFTVGFTLQAGLRIPLAIVP